MKRNTAKKRREENTEKLKLSRIAPKHEMQTATSCSIILKLRTLRTLSGYPRGGVEGRKGRGGGGCQLI